MIQLPIMSNPAQFGAVCTDFATNHPEGTAEANLGKAVTIGKQLAQEAEDAKAKYDALSAGVQRRSSQLVALRGEQEKQAAIAFTDALSNTDMDATDYAEAYATRAQLISFLVGGIEYSREVLLPTALLKMLDADMRMCDQAAVIADFRAVIAGVARYKAAQHLIEEDGVAFLSVGGKAYEAYMLAVAAHRRAYTAFEALTHVRKREAERDNNNKLKGLI